MPGLKNSGHFNSTSLHGTVGVLAVSFLCVLLNGFSLSSACAGDDDGAGLNSTATDQELGKRIYRSGVLPDGKSVSAVTRKNIVLSSKQVICIGCHRRSGLGSSEGGTLVPPVAGSLLFASRAEQRRELYATHAPSRGSRPAYTIESLKTALREGRDPRGREFNALMPRYNLDDAALDALIAYLKSMDTTPSPGVTDKIIHFATIVTPGVSQTRKASLTAVMNAYLRDINAGTRRETKRARFSPWHKTWPYEAYRKWKLHVWELQGNPRDWPAQLKGFYRKQPVFAVLNGVSDADWSPIHGFCREYEIPCILPTTNMPVADTEDFYSIYLTKGVTLEADALAKHLSETSKAKHVVQAYRDTTTARMAAAALRSKLQNSLNNIVINDIPLAGGEKFADAFRGVSNLDDDSDLVLWLGRDELGDLFRGRAGLSGFDNIYLSTSFTGDDIDSLTFNAAHNVYLLHQTVLPGRMGKHIVRAKNWAKARRVEYSDAEVMANAYLALTITADVTRHMRGLLIRDYFIEKIEHAMENTLFHSVYPHLSLGPGQRFASKGCYVIGPVRGKNSAIFSAANEWIVP